MRDLLYNLDGQYLTEIFGGGGQQSGGLFGASGAAAIIHGLLHLLLY